MLARGFDLGQCSLRYGPKQNPTRDYRNAASHILVLLAGHERAAPGAKRWHGIGLLEWALQDLIQSDGL
jgi:hypothetical protein